MSPRPGTKQPYTDAAERQLCWSPDPYQEGVLIRWPWDGPHWWRVTRNEPCPRRGYVVYGVPA